jgi:hypothetical protein
VRDREGRYSDAYSELLLGESRFLPSHLDALTQDHPRA